MRTEHALRYVLLKHVWKFRGRTSDALRHEVARSLTVERLDRGFHRGGVMGKIIDEQYASHLALYVHAPLHAAKRS